MKIAIVGAGSGYMPGVIRGVLHRASSLRGAELAFYDLDFAAQALMARLARGMLKGLCPVSEHESLKGALDGADFVFTTFRPGGMAARHLDEAIPLAHGVVGQETAGPGGFLMACRSVPVLLEIASLAPESAWIINYTNPTSIVTDAVLPRFPRIIGLCDQSVGDTGMWEDLLGLDGLEVDWIGLNHFTWADRVRHRGVPVDLPSLLDGLSLPDGGATPWRDPSRMAELGKALGYLPNSYAKYYFFHDEVVRELQAKGTTRAEDILATLPAFFEQVTAESYKDDPDPSRERGGGEHGEFAIDTICAIAGDERRRLILNVPNAGSAIPSLPSDTVVEIPCTVGASGPVPLPMGDIPLPTRGLTQAVAAYERLASHAATTGDRRVALQALMAHPFVRSKHTAEAILDEGLAAHRDWLPQFLATAPAATDHEDDGTGQNHAADDESALALLVRDGRVLLVGGGDDRADRDGHLLDLLADPVARPMDDMARIHPVRQRVDRARQLLPGALDLLLELLRISVCHPASLGRRRPYHPGDPRWVISLAGRTPHRCLESR